MGELAFVVVFFVALAIRGLAVRGVVVLVRRDAGRRGAVASIASFGLGVACVLWGMFVEPHRLEVTEHVVETAKLPRGTKLRIARISDLHVGIGAPAADDVARAINERSVDLLVFAGDAVPASIEKLVNAEWFTPEFHRVIDDVRAPLGRFGVRRDERPHRLDVDAAGRAAHGVGHGVGERQGRLAERGARVHVGAAIEQHAHDVDEAALGGHVQRRAPLRDEAEGGAHRVRLFGAQERELVVVAERHQREHVEVGAALDEVMDRARQSRCTSTWARPSPS